MTSQPPSISSSAIVAIVSALRGDEVSAFLCSGTDEKPIHVWQSLVYAVGFRDSKDIWAVRVPLYSKSNLKPGAIPELVSYEMVTLRRLSDIEFRWSPRLIGGDASYDNSIKHPYLVLTWIPGTPLEWTPAIPAQQEQRDKVLRQVVDLQLELVRCTKESRPTPLTASGSKRQCYFFRFLTSYPGPGTSMLKFLTDAVDSQIHNAMSGDLSERNLGICLYSERCPAMLSTAASIRRWSLYDTTT